LRNDNIVRPSQADRLPYDAVANHVHEDHKLTEIKYKIGDATAPTASGMKIVAHICNNIGGWGKGFVVAISKRWPEPEAAYRAWYQDRDKNDFALGAIQIVQVAPEIRVANMIGQHGIQRKGVTPPDGKPPIRYEAVEAALNQLAAKATELKASVHMPRIGCGLAGGTWDKIEPIIERTLCTNGVEVFIYDLR
jgi:O-acetyl-ADP-ribose deacetylase (regulator of RNase III)